MMEIRIEPDGTVGTATVMHSIPLLDGAALDAVKQWQFTPTLLNGQPVAVFMTVTINFSLGQSESVAPANGRGRSRGPRAGLGASPRRLQGRLPAVLVP